MRVGEMGEAEHDDWLSDRIERYRGGMKDLSPPLEARGAGRLRGGPPVRRLVPLVMRVRRGMTLGVRGVVIEGDTVLLVRHGYAAGWHFPGGGIEPGETARTALDRELVEEAGIRPTAEPALHGIFFNRTFGGRDHVAVYLVRDYSQGPVPPPSREIAEQRFFPLADLPQGTTGPTRRRLAEILDGARLDELW
jgi:8-oxo-dGTP pyrophosphatase MutT (NUDIX family)